MIITQQHRREARELVAGHWAARRWLSVGSQQTLTQVVFEEVEREMALLEPTRSDVERRVWSRREVKQLKPKGFLPLAFLFTTIIGWLIGKMLDYFWDQCNKERAEASQC